MKPRSLSREELRRDNVRLEDLVCELQRSQIELERLDVELRRSNEELERFAYQGQLDADAEDYIRFILAGTERVRQLMEALLVYSRVGRVKLHLEWVDSQALVEAGIANLGLDIDDPRVSVGDGLPAVREDRNLLGQVFQNLIGNALKFAGESEVRVRVAAQRHAAEWLFSVTDNGIGIEPRDAERVFDVFARLHTREDDDDGAGIGLAVCRRVVERHGGLIWIQPAEGGGTTLCFTLPGRNES